jgi:hypothetical protein
MVGWSGLAYAIMIVVTFIVTIAFAASMISTAMKAGQAPASTSTPIVTQIVSLIANLVFCWMIFGVANYLTKVRNVSAVMPIGMVIIVLVILEIIGGFVGVRGVSFNMTGAGIFAIVMLVIMIAKGILLIVFGVKALGGGSGAWKAFGILVIIAGALTAIIVGLIIAPFVWIAAGIVLMVAAFGSAKAPAAA